MQYDNIIPNRCEVHIKKGARYRHYDDADHEVDVIDVVDTKVYFNVNGLDFPRNISLVLYKHDDMLYVDEVVTFYDDFNLIEPVYEYQYAFKENDDNQWKITNMYYTEEETAMFLFAEVQKLEFTKRERKCI